MRRPGQVLSRLHLLEHAWDFAYENRSNVVDVYVRHLRRKTPSANAAWRPEAT
jgi:two-component system OmpR family response regulator